jgi:hypothetical protein
MHIRRLTILGAVAGGLAAAGCGSSSSINPESSASYREGVHLDTLAVQAANAGYSDRYRLLSYPIAALMENLPPSSVSLSVDGATETYQAVVLELVGTTAGSSPTPSDSIYAIVAWSDTNANELVFTEIALPDTLEDAEDLTDTISNPDFDSATVLSVSLPSANSHCHAFSLPEPNDAVSDFLAATCSAGTATAAFTLYFTPSAANPHSVFTLATQSINAVRLVLPANNGGMERIRPLLTGPRRIKMVVDGARSGP